MVTAEIFSGTPGSMTLLGAGGGFTPVANSFADAAMAPIFLTAGATYFVALEGIYGLGSNLTVTGTDVESLVWYQDQGDRSFSSGPHVQPGSGPIFEFSGVPVPVRAQELRDDARCPWLFGFRRTSQKAKRKGLVSTPSSTGQLAPGKSPSTRCGGASGLRYPLSICAGRWWAGWTSPHDTGRGRPLPRPCAAEHSQNFRFTIKLAV